MENAPQPNDPITPSVGAQATSDLKSKPQPGAIEAVSMIGAFPAFFGIMCLIAGGPGGGIMLALVALPLWLIAVIPSTIFAIKGLRSAHLMVPLAANFRYAICGGTLIFNSVFLAWIAIVSISELT
jgi:hypothetical protein